MIRRNFVSAASPEIPSKRGVTTAAWRGDTQR